MRKIGVPAKLRPGDRGNSRLLAATATAHRFRAIVDDLLLLINDEAKRGGRDLRRHLIDKLFAAPDPVAYLIALRELAGCKDIAFEGNAALGNAAAASLAGLFAGAAASAAVQFNAKTQAEAQDADDIIDVTPKPAEAENPQSPPDDDAPVDW